MTKSHFAPSASTQPSAPLYDARFEHDACGVGFVATTSRQPSHEIVRLALESLSRLSHRGAVDADGKTGDGAGLLTQLPRKLLAREAAKLGHSGVDPQDLALGMFFLPRKLANRVRAREIVQRISQDQGIPWIGWRQVPVDVEALGEKAKSTRPEVGQALLRRPEGVSPADFERRLYLMRKAIERAAAEEGLRDLYTPSLSSRTVVYKGLFHAPQLAEFYADLRDPDFEATLALFHQRYSTNTFPNWALAQPFRMLAHNGEINTLLGNRNWMRAREPMLHSPLWNGQVENLKPVVWADGSDSASLDNVLELLEMAGRDVVHSVMMLVPEAWENVDDIDEDLRAFYHYHAGLMEPWDGPAALAFADGRLVGAALDRNGLRPIRYKVTADGLVVAASEVGTLDLDEADVVEKGRLGPGQLLVVDMETGTILRNEEAKRRVVEDKPYLEWLATEPVRLSDGAAPSANGNGHSTNGTSVVEAPSDGLDLAHRLIAFGFTAEEQKFVVDAMATEGKEPTWSMGDDAPLAVLSRLPRRLSDFLRQRFAQVTNPPIDPLREASVMSLYTYLGRRGSVLEETAEAARLLNLSSPLLDESEMRVLRELSASPKGAVRVAVLPAVFPVAEGAAGVERCLAELAKAAEAAVDAGDTILVLSDRPIDADHGPLPMLVAVGAVHHRLIRRGQRLRADIVAETGDRWDVHQLALLIGYGAGAVCPWLAWEPRESRADARARASRGRRDFRHSLEAGLLKIMSKMGISTRRQLPRRPALRGPRAGRRGGGRAPSPAPPAAIGGHRLR